MSNTTPNCVTMLKILKLKNKVIFFEIYFLYRSIVYDWKEKFCCNIHISKLISLQLSRKGIYYIDYD